MKIINLYVDEGDNERLDLYLSQELDQVSRTQVQNLIKTGMVLVNGQIKKPRYLVNKGDFIDIVLPVPKSVEINPENLPINIVYEDEDLVIINKEQGMVVHPAIGNYSGTLVNALLYHIKELSSINGIIRSGIVHRLDKDTTGLLVIAKNDYSHEFLSEQFKARTVKREYIALVEGSFKINNGIINRPIGRNPKDRMKMAVTEVNSKVAITKYKVLQTYTNYTLLDLELKTGRTHQIRVHLSYINHPIVGDLVYGKKSNKYNIHKQLLHAKKLGFNHPKTKEYIEFDTEIPERFITFMKELK